jgi:Sec-independent protein secretion pathway component TatC
MIIKIYLNELKFYFMYSVLMFFITLSICYYYLNQILFIIILPLVRLNNMETFTNSSFIFTNITELFFTYFFLLLNCTFYIILPFLIYQFGLLFSNGFYTFE